MRIFIVLTMTFIMATTSFAGILETAVNPANGHTYHLLTSANWMDSEAEAVSLGGHLVTINDQDENDFVFSEFGSPVRNLWIGLTDEAVEGTFVWVSGEPVSFTNWHVGNGEPNNIGNEDYAHIFVQSPTIPDGSWNDARDVAVGAAGSNFQSFGVVEVVPEPASLTILAVGSMVLLRRRVA